jgi:alpha-L-rhamnosidase
MNSFNHYAYGSIGAWLYQSVAGIEVDSSQPGYKHSILRPHVGGGLTHAAATLKTNYGELVSAWEQDKGTFEWRVTVPANTTATIHLPANDKHNVTLDGKTVDSLVHELGAGNDHFDVE